MPNLPRTMGTLFLLLGVLLPATVAADVPSADVTSQDFIRTWLLCGPFPNPLPQGVSEYMHDETCLGYYTDYLAPIGGEASVKPVQDLEFTGSDGVRHKWELYQSPQDYVNLTNVYEETQERVAYAACGLVSGSERETVIGLGSNDGVKAWLNGEVIWDNHLPRGADADADWVLARVNKGSNLLLLKIDQGWGDWGFYARVLDRNEKQAELIAETTPEIGISYEIGNDHMTVCMGHNSRYLILDPIPPCTVSLVDSSGKEMATASGRLGDSVSLSCEDVPDGPYWVEGTAQLPNERIVTAKAFSFRGSSKIGLRYYDRDGSLPSRGVTRNRIEMLDEKFETVPMAVTGDKQGAASLLRPDVSPFYLRVLVESSDLGRRWYLADNQGRGYVVGRRGMTLDLPLEAAKSLRSRIEKMLGSSSDLADWLRENLEQRLRKARLPRWNVRPERVYEVIDTLSSLKSALPSNDRVAVWYSPGIEKVAKEEPVPEIELDAVHVSLAQNEYEPFQIVLNPKESLRNLSVDFGPLRSRSGGAIDTLNLTVNLVEYVEVETVTDHFGTLGPWPDPIPPIREPFTANAGENKSVWVTVHAPKDQPAGIYSGEMMIVSDGTSIARIPLEIEVYNFTLPDETNTETAYGVGVNRDYHGPLTDEQLREVHDLYMQLCASHRISPYSPHAGAGIDIRSDGDPPRPVVDFAKFDAAMSRYLDEFKFTTFNMGGIPGELGGHPRYSEEYNRLFKQVYMEVQEHLREKGWLDKAYWYWVDEPPKSRYADVKKGMELLKASCPDIRRLLTCNAEDAPVPYFFGLVNLWVPIMNRYVPERAHQRQELGETVWWYVCTGPKGPYPNNFITHPAINHRIRWWMIDRYALDGSLYWSVTWWHQNPWEQAMSISPSGGPWGNGDGRLLYPPRRSKPTEPIVEPPVSSIRFENLRDGIEDREYLLMLRQTATGQGSQAQKARGIISDIERNIVPTLTCYDQNPAVFLPMRHRVAKTIESGQQD